MALKYKELKEKLDNKPLTTYELELIKDVENYIDKEIERQFDKSIYKEISIDMCYPNFTYSPTAKCVITDLGVSRLPKMKAELERRFTEAGWVIRYHEDDSMSMNSADYMILKGKD